MTNILYVAKTANIKTGPIPVTYSPRDTCPQTCPHLDSSCYGRNYHTKMVWDRVDRGEGVTWDKLCERVADLPAGQLWRHNVLGDLPTFGKYASVINFAAMEKLANANMGRRGFTYTHHDMFMPDNSKTVFHLNMWGFTVNLSLDSMGELEQVWGLNKNIIPIAPLVITLPSWVRENFTTKFGAKVVICPAVTKGITCEKCRLCAVPDRRVVIGFPAHGQYGRLIDMRVAKEVIDA